MVGCRPEQERSLGTFLFTQADAHGDKRRQKLILVWADRNQLGRLGEKAVKTDRPVPGDSSKASWGPRKNPRSARQARAILSLRRMQSRPTDIEIRCGPIEGATAMEGRLRWSNGRALPEATPEDRFARKRWASHAPHDAIPPPVRVSWKRALEARTTWRRTAGAGINISLGKICRSGRLPRRGGWSDPPHRAVAVAADRPTVQNDQHPGQSRQAWTEAPAPEGRRSRRIPWASGSDRCQGWITELVFRPGAFSPRDLTFDIGTAGSTSLVLQTLHLPLAMRAESAVRVVLTGGTFNPKAPAHPFLEHTWRENHLAAFVSMKLKHAGSLLTLSVAMLLCASCSQTPNSAAPAQASTSAASSATSVQVTRVVSQKLDTTVKLPAQLVAYEVVDVYPKVTGFVKWIKVDRGSRVKAGQQIAQLEAPEMLAQRAEANPNSDAGIATLRCAGQARGRSIDLSAPERGRQNAGGGSGKRSRDRAARSRSRRGECGGNGEERQGRRSRAACGCAT